MSEMDAEGVRLQKVLANAGVASRRVSAQFHHQVNLQE